MNLVEAVSKFSDPDVKSVYINYYDYCINLCKEPSPLDIGDDNVVKRVIVSEDMVGCTFLQITYNNDRKVEYYLNNSNVNYCKVNYYNGGL